jgi:hypothetical protein
MGLQRVVNFMNNSGDVCLRTWSRTNLAPSHSERRTDILESKSVTSEEAKRRLKPWMYRALVSAIGSHSAGRMPAWMHAG